MPTDYQILQVSYTLLPVSEGMKSFFCQWGIPDLESLLAFDLKKILSMNNFNPHLYKELIILLQDYNIDLDEYYNNPGFYLI